MLRFNFRGVGRSEGLFDNGPGELADAATALQAYNADARLVLYRRRVVRRVDRHAVRRPEVDAMLTIMQPEGSMIGSPAPIAAAIGSSIR